MRVLLIKTSSMGDIIHTLPALTDAGLAIPGISFDWVVEDSFADIPTWHPLVNQVIPVALRRWRKGLFSRDTRHEWRALRERLGDQRYDLILDAQGLVKSSVLTFLANGPRAGLDFRSAREGLAAFAYQHKHKVNFYQHAIVRMRSLFSQALDYPLPATPPDFGLDREQFAPQSEPEKYLVFLNGTTWKTKQWPESYWLELAKLAAQQHLRVKMSGGNADEMTTVERLAAHSPNIDVIPHLSIAGMAKLLANAQAAVGVDTGFGHLAAALNVPTISLYGATNAEYTGAIGKASLHLQADFPCSPCLKRTCTYKGISAVTPACYGTLPPALVWEAVLKVCLNTHPYNKAVKPALR